MLEPQRSAWSVLLAVLAVAAAVAVSLIGPARAAPAVPGQEEPTTTSRPEILVPGPTDPATTIAATSTTVTDDGNGLTDRARSVLADETGRTVAVVIGGLLLVALILAVLTVRYWRKTRPARLRAPATAAPPHQVGSRRGR